MITIKQIADYLSAYDVAEYDGVRETGKARYNLYMLNGELIPPYKADDAAERFTALRDVIEYAGDETPERITATETLSDPSFAAVCEDLFIQIYSSITIQIPTGNWYEDGEQETGREIVIYYRDGADLLQKLSALSDDDYRDGLIAGRHIPEFIEEIGL